MFNFNAFTADRLALLALLLLILLAALLLAFRRQKGQPPPPRAPLTPRRLLIRFLRLSGFGIFAIVLILTTLILYEDIKTVNAEIAPANRPVALPPNLPFAVEEVTFTGGDDIQMAGWYVPSSNGATVILLHGYGGTRLEMLWYAGLLTQAGYGVLMYDERASGESGGDHRSYGWEDAPDVGGALAFLKQRGGSLSEQIGIAGCSMGGQIALQGAAAYPEIAAVWADGPGVIRAADLAPPRNLIDFLVLYSNYFIDSRYEQQLNMTAPPPMIERIGQIAPRPIMLVGGDQSLGIFPAEETRLRHYASYAGSNAQVWIIHQATHCDGPKLQPEVYAQRFLTFFNESLRK